MSDDSNPNMPDKPKKKGKKNDNKNSADANNNDLCETKNYFSTRFTIKFRHNADICYIAYHYPYTYTFLQVSII